MEIEFDVKQVFQDRLASSMGLDKYQYIMNNVRRVNISTNADFQRTFNGLYIVRRNEDWRDIYYKLFEEIKEGAELAHSLGKKIYCTRYRDNRTRS